jgi:hypothetical protein
VLGTIAQTNSSLTDIGAVQSAAFVVKSVAREFASTAVHLEWLNCVLLGSYAKKTCFLSP